MKPALELVRVHELRSVLDNFYTYIWFGGYGEPEDFDIIGNAWVWWVP